MSASESQRRSPYQGLIPYGEDDAPFFFGREKETRLIIANLFASPLTLLYGESGVGKSSVLRAGVAHSLHDRQDLMVVVFSSWQGQPVRELKNTIANIAVATDDPLSPRTLRLHSAKHDASLVEFVSLCNSLLSRRLMIILDQFEEYFLYHPDDDNFADEFPAAVTQIEAPVSFLISLREDSYAKLDRFEGRIPTLYDNYLRIEHLERDAARAAIEEPIAKYNRLYLTDGFFSIEPELVEVVLEQVETGRVVIGASGRGVVETTARYKKRQARIETPYLQLVLMRLWEEEKRTGSLTLRKATLEKLGGAGRIVHTHLDAVMSQLPLRLRNAATHVFHYLVTPSGSKIALTVRDLAGYSGVSSTRVEPLLKRLAAPDIRLLRSIETGTDEEQDRSYEIFHDALAAAIIDWRLRHRRDYRKMLLGFLAGAMVGISLFLLAPTVFPQLGGMSASVGSLGPSDTGKTQAALQKRDRGTFPIGRSDPMVSVTYDEAQAVGGSELPLTVTVFKASVGVVKIFPAKDAEDFIRITAVGSPESLDDAPPGTRSYNYIVGINPRAGPGTYLFTVGLNDKKSSYVERSYPLYVGAEVDNRNYLEIYSDRIRLTAGESAIVFLTVTNRFPDYAVLIHGITLEPGGSTPVQINIQPGESRELPVRVRVGAQNINQAGFSDVRSFNIALAYKDEHGRSGVSQKRLEVIVFSNLGLILLVALAGGIVGAVVEVLLQRGYFKFSTLREKALRR